MGNDPTLLSRLRNEVTFFWARRHAGEQGDSGRSPLQRISAALVKGQLLEDVGRHDHRDRHLLITLGDK
jgi:hypothetical protein